MNNWNESYKRGGFSSFRQTPTLVRLLLVYSGGLIKNEKQANMVLLLIAAVAVGLTILINVDFTETPQPQNPSDNIELPGITAPFP